MVNASSLGSTWWPTILAHHGRLCFFKGYTCTVAEKENNLLKQRVFQMIQSVRVHKRLTIILEFFLNRILLA